MKILITGTTGFIGRHIVSSLLNNADYKLYVLARDEKKAYDLFKDNVTICKGDIKEAESLKIPLKDKDIVINSAALMSNYEYKGKKEYYETNVKGIVNILASRDISRIRRFLHISSVGVYGDTGPLPAKEDRNYGSDLSVYEWSKKEAELELFRYCKEYNIPFTVLRLSQLYGPGMYYGWPDTMRSIIRGNMLIPGKGEGKIHLLHIHDCIEAVKLAIKSEKAVNKIYNIAGPEVIALKEVFKTIASLLGVTEPRHVPYFMLYPVSMALNTLPLFMKTKNMRLLTPHRVSFFKDNHAYDISAAGEELGYNPAVNVTDGFSEMISWCREERLF